MSDQSDAPVPAKLFNNWIVAFTDYVKREGTFQAMENFYQALEVYQRSVELMPGQGSLQESDVRFFKDFVIRALQRQVIRAARHDDSNGRPGDSEQVWHLVLNPPASQAIQAFLRETGWMNPSVFSIQALPSLHQPYFRETGWMNPSVSSIQALLSLHQPYFSQHDEDEDTQTSQIGGLLLGLNGENDIRNESAEMLEAGLLFSNSLALPSRRQSRYDGRYSEQVRREVLNTPASQAIQAFMRAPGWMNPSVSSIRALPSLHQLYRRSVELMPGLGSLLESDVCIFEDFVIRALQRQLIRAARHDDSNGRPGDRYTVIGLISTISFTIYSILFGLTGQMYMEEDGSFFSHHHVMVTISMLSMVYLAFSGVFLCVIYYLATADPTHTYRRCMRFLSGTFVSAACFGPAVLFMAMFVQPLGFKVFAWAVLAAALTRVGFYIGG